MYVFYIIYIYGGVLSCMYISISTSISSISIYLLHPHHSSSSKQVRAGSQGRSLEVKLDPQARE